MQFSKWKKLGGRPVCSCPPGHSGNPLSYCRRSECLDHTECAGHMACRNGNCVDPCAGTCGANANCEVSNIPFFPHKFYHFRILIDNNGRCYLLFVFVCVFFVCVSILWLHPKNINKKITIQVRNHVPVCSCPSGYRGDPFSYCTRADPGWYPFTLTKHQSILTKRQQNFCLTKNTKQNQSQKKKQINCDPIFAF